MCNIHKDINIYKTFEYLGVLRVSVHQVNGFCLNAAHLSPPAKLHHRPGLVAILNSPPSKVFEALGFTGALKMPKKIPNNII